MAQKLQLDMMTHQMLMSFHQMTLKNFTLLIQVISLKAILAVLPFPLTVHIFMLGELVKSNLMVSGNSLSVVGIELEREVI
jgi:hypothetical protein